MLQHMQGDGAFPFDGAVYFLCSNRCCIAPGEIPWGWGDARPCTSANVTDQRRYLSTGEVSTPHTLGPTWTTPQMHGTQPACASCRHTVGWSWRSPSHPMGRGCSAAAAGRESWWCGTQAAERATLPWKET